MKTDYILRSQAGRDVFVCSDEQSARSRMADMALRGTRLRLFKVVRQELELAA